MMPRADGVSLAADMADHKESEFLRRGESLSFLFWLFIKYKIPTNATIPIDIVGKWLYDVYILERRDGS
jgi:hypothetical protein